MITRTAHLYNRGPHTIAYRGEVDLHEGGRVTWHGTDTEVQEQHRDVIIGVLLMSEPGGQK